MNRILLHSILSKQQRKLYLFMWWIFCITQCCQECKKCNKFRDCRTSSKCVCFFGNCKQIEIFFIDKMSVGHFCCKDLRWLQKLYSQIQDRFLYLWRSSALLRVANNYANDHLILILSLVYLIVAFCSSIGFMHEVRRRIERLKQLLVWMPRSIFWRHHVIIRNYFQTWNCQLD